MKYTVEYSVGCAVEYITEYIASGLLGRVSTVSNGCTKMFTSQRGRGRGYRCLIHCNWCCDLPYVNADDRDLVGGVVDEFGV